MEAGPEALIAWLEARFAGPVHTVEPPQTNADGFDSEIHFLHLAGPALPDEWARPLVLRVKSDPDRGDEARLEAAVQGWAADHGYPAPRVLRVFDAGELVARPAQVMERLAGSMMLDRVRKAPWQTRRLVRTLAAAQAALHRLPTDGFPTGEDLVEHRLRLPRHVAELLPASGIADGLARIDPLLPRLREGAASVCHGDFHPLNVLVDGGDVGVVDWTDAGLGDRHGDVARTLLLFDIAWVAAGSAAERAVLKVFGPRLARGYRRAYERELPLDGAALDRWTPLHLLHGWSQTVALHAGLFDRGPDVDDDRTSRAPFALTEELARRFHAAADRALG